MRRSKNSPEPSARGNFVPPSDTTAPDSLPGDEPTAAPAPRGGRFSPRTWQVATRLNAILLIPVLVGLVMGGFQVNSSIDTWNEAEDAENTARLVRASLTYANALFNERDISAVPLLQGKGPDDPDVTRARAATDKAAEAFDEATRNMPHTPGLERRLSLFREAEPQLTTLRGNAYTSAYKGVETEEGYLAVARPLMEFANELGPGPGNITNYGRTVHAISLTKSASSLKRSIGMHMLVEPGPTESQLAGQRVALTSYAYLEDLALKEYTGGGTAADVSKLERTVQDIEAERAAMTEAAQKEDPDHVPPPAQSKTFVSELGRLASTEPAARAELSARGITPANWWSEHTLMFDGYRRIEADLADAAVTEAARTADDARRDALIAGAVVVIALLAAFVLAGLVARRMSQSVRRLRDTAFEIVEQRLPLLVDQLSRTAPSRVDTKVAPIPVSSPDEIGDVARAFDQVHREAVRLASEQAVLRGNIDAIFTNLSRRNQSLIEGQLSLIGTLRKAAGPDQLESLFRLDHLATRMRRNSENLLVLAGGEPAPRWDRPVPLGDVLRAAASEAEQYDRIELYGIPEAEIHGRAVTDLVHLLAELLENATTFSSPQTKVKVTATRLPDGRVMIEIHDKGIGLTAEDFADINHRLANPPALDASVSGHMGLFVVGRLSDRHGIQVQLRPSGERSGTTSLVMLPDTITGGGGNEQHGDDTEAFTVSQIVPERTVQGDAVTDPPLRTAAELGFDDSRYAEIPDDIRGMGPAARSLMREERRAALDAPSPPQLTAGSPEDPAHVQETFQAPGHEGEFAPPAGIPQGYDSRQGGHTEGQGHDGGPQEPQNTGYDPQAYASGQQQAYDAQQQTTYGEGYYAQQEGPLPQDDPYASAGGYSFPSATEPVRPGGTAAGTSAGDAFTASGDALPDPAPSTFPASGDPSAENNQLPQDGYRNGWSAQYSAHTPVTESVQADDVREQDSVGFERPGPAVSQAHELTDAGLPRRVSTTGGVNGTSGARRVKPEPAGSPAESNGDSGRRSANDERRPQAGALRKPAAGGVTSSGLPRRVPKANLVEGTAETTPQGGPQVSRAPEDIRGRLSNLRRGVQRGRNAGSETKNGQGLGPDSTYDQER